LSAATRSPIGRLGGSRLMKYSFSAQILCPILTFSIAFAPLSYAQSQARAEVEAATMIPKTHSDLKAQVAQSERLVNDLLKKYPGTDFYKDRALSQPTKIEEFHQGRIRQYYAVTPVFKELNKRLGYFVAVKGLGPDQTGDPRLTISFWDSQFKKVKVGTTFQVDPALGANVNAVQFRLTYHHLVNRLTRKLLQEEVIAQRAKMRKLKHARVSPLKKALSLILPTANANDTADKNLDDPNIDRAPTDETAIGGLERKIGGWIRSSINETLLLVVASVTLVGSFILMAHVTFALTDLKNLPKTFVVGAVAGTVFYVSGRYLLNYIIHTVEGLFGGGKCQSVMRPRTMISRRRRTRFRLWIPTTGGSNLTVRLLCELDCSNEKRHCLPTTDAK